MALLELMDATVRCSCSNPIQISPVIVWLPGRGRRSYDGVVLVAGEKALRLELQSVKFTNFLLNGAFGI